MRKSIINSSIVFILILLSLICSSCENFLDGDNIRDEIVDQIYIANHDCPVATVEEPVFSDSGVARNKAIIVSFTMAIDPQSFENSYQITDSLGNNLMSNFLEPKWSNENTLVTIAANEQNLIDLKGKRSLDIFFNLSTDCKTPDGLPINSAINHKYRINDSVDNTAPTLSDNSYAEKSASYFANSLLSNGGRLIEGAITADNENQICTSNHINSKINFYVEGNDYGGSAVRGHIYCKRIKEVTGSAVNEAAKDFVFNLTKQTDSDLYSTLYTLDLGSADLQDGLYEVKLHIQDTSNLDSENYKLYYVIRDTSLAYCITSRMVNDTSLFRREDEIAEPTIEDANDDPIYLAWLQRKRTFDTQIPTLSKIEDFRTRILFDRIDDDVYYTSSLTNNTYAERDLSYFLSWGLNKEQLTSPVRIDGNTYTYDYSKASVGDVIYYNLPAAFITFLKNNEDSDIILKAIITDSVGNQNVIYSLWPKKINFHYYTVTNDANSKKKVELNFSSLPLKDTFEDKVFHGKWRIFYAPLGSLNEEDEDALSELTLKRNGDTYVANSDGSDKLEITQLDEDSKYVVYIQTAYDSDSVYNGQYNCTTFGPLTKIIVDTTENATVGTPGQPVFNVEKIGGEKNSGLITLEISIENYNSNFKYIPYYWDIIKLGYWVESPAGAGNYIYIPDEWGWVKLDAHSEESFTIQVNNRLTAPLGKNQIWDHVKWDYTDYGGGNCPDNTYFMAVENCLSLGRPSYTGTVRLVAVNNSSVSEAAECEYNLSWEDDNIPPKISSDITKHDSHLSFDGHSFEFSDLIRDEEGSLTEYFTYYYTPYNHAWGDNLNVLSENQIKMLPSGRAKYTGSCWLNGQEGAQYRLDTSIPVYGLPDGDYMYFAKLEDRFGNYTYATLGKAHIGTFKNKLKVELDDEGKYFKSTLELEPEESFFDKNMINVQICYDTNWDNYYEWLNELQNCKKTTIDGKLCLYSYIADTDDPNSFIYRSGTEPNFSYTNYTLPRFKNENEVVTNENRTLSNGNWYRITMQSFNENYMTAQGGDGVSYKYGRPYTSISNCSDPNTDPDLWNRNLWWVDGEQKYDVCTDETVSNTVYYYVPRDNNNDREDFSDYYASFFSSTATPRSNHSMLVNVLVSNCDLGQDTDEWERRGKLVATHKYDQWDNTTRSISCDFNQSVAAEDVSKAREKGQVYYAAVVHFAKGESAVSDVYTMYGF